MCPHGGYRPRGHNIAFIALFFIKCIKTRSITLHFCNQKCMHMYMYIIIIIIVHVLVTHNSPTFSRTTDPGHWSGLVAFTYTNPDLVREITRVISRCEHKLSQDLLYVNATSPDQWPGSLVRENTRTSDPGTTFGVDQLICERYNFDGPLLWRCGLHEEERTHSGSWLHFSPPACSGSTNMG